MSKARIVIEVPASVKAKFKKTLKNSGQTISHVLNTYIKGYK